MKESHATSHATVPLPSSRVVVQTAKFRGFRPQHRCLIAVVAWSSASIATRVASCDARSIAMHTSSGRVMRARGFPNGSSHISILSAGRYNKTLAIPYGVVTIVPRRLREGEISGVVSEGCGEPRTVAVAVVVAIDSAVGC